MKKDSPTASEIGRIGGKAGKGAAKRRSAEHYARMVAARKRLEMSFSIDEVLDAIAPEGRGKRLDITTTNGDGPKKTSVVALKPKDGKP